MTNKLSFDEIKEKHLDTLIMYVPIVARVHGGNHPEFHQVHTLFNALNEKIKGANPGSNDMNVEFAQLRQITNNYTVPADTCESFEAVYNMLEEMDKAYNS